MPDVVIPEEHGIGVYTWAVEGRANPISCTLGFGTFNSSIPPEDVAEAMFEDAGGDIAKPFNGANMAEEFTFLGVTVTLRRAGNLIQGASPQSPQVGSVSAVTPTMINGTLLLQKRTAFVGRKFRGRMYVPICNISEGAIDPMGNISSGTFPSLQTLIEEWTFAALTSTIYNPVVLHSDLTAPTNITTMPLLQKAATQRRRLR